MRALWALCLIAVLFPLASYGQITPLMPHIPDSVYIKAEVFIETRVYEEDTVYGYSPARRFGGPGVQTRMGAWMTGPALGAVEYQHISAGTTCPWAYQPEAPIFESSNGCIGFVSMYQVESSTFFDPGLFILYVEAGGDHGSDLPYQEAEKAAWEYFLEHGKLVIEQDTLHLKQSYNCGDHGFAGRPDTTATGWACWTLDTMLLLPNDIVQMSISSKPPPPPAPYAPTELTMWQHRASNGSRVRGAVWLSWRIPVNGAGPVEQLRIEREHGIHYEYKVLRDGDNEWKTILLEDTKEGVVDEIIDPLLGPIAYQRRKYLVTGLGRNGEYSFCIRAVNAAGTSDQVCNLDVITPVFAEVSELPAIASLFRNYPNPFNPSTTVTYTLDRSGPVELTVCDLTGRTVSTLVDGVRPAGHHEVRFNADGLPTGTYIYRLRAGTETLTQTMTLIR